MVKWERVVEIARKEAREYYKKNGIPLTLRGLFYLLVSKNIIPNTKSAYQTLSSYIARMRYLGEFEWYLIHDETRKFIWGDVGYSIADTQKILEELKNLTPEKKEQLLKEYLKSRYRVSIKQWEGQQKRVLIVTEKAAIFDIVRQIVREQLNWDVSISFARGFESATAIKSVADWIKEQIDNGIQPVVIFVYDFDPSGEYASIRDFTFRTLLVSINNDTEKWLEKWNDAKSDEEKEKILNSLINSIKIKPIFEKVMLTIEQVKAYNLPPVPEQEEVRRKLERDPRARWFAEKYGFLGQVEVDAIISIRPDEARRILDEAIRKHFDMNIYQSVKEREDKLREEVNKLL